MSTICPRCASESRDVARFCASCGMALEAGVDGSSTPGRVRHPRPADVPPGFIPCQDAAQIYFRWESSLGGAALIDTEGLKITIFNAGYALRDATVALRGEGRDGAEVLSREYAVERLPQGFEVELEAPSYDLREPMRVLKMSLVSAEFDREMTDQNS